MPRAIIRARVPVARGASETGTAQALSTFAVAHSIIGAFRVSVDAGGVLFVSECCSVGALAKGAVHSHEVGIAITLVVRFAAPMPRARVGAACVGPNGGKADEESDEYGLHFFFFKCLF